MRTVAFGALDSGLHLRWCGAGAAYDDALATCPGGVERQHIAERRAQVRDRVGEGPIPEAPTQWHARRG